MRLTRYIAIIAAALCTASCLTEGIGEPVAVTDSNSTIKVFGRVARYEQHVVSTRAANKLPDEAYTSSVVLAVFPIVDGQMQECISYSYLPGNSSYFTIDRKDAIFDGYSNTPFALYLFANIPALPNSFDELTDRSLDYFMNLAYSNSGVFRPQTGFPMVGSIGDTVSEGGDGTTFILKPETDGKVGLPTSNGTPTDYLGIAMKALYAKMTFTIKVDPDQQLEEGNVPTFTMESYTVHNIPAKVSIKGALNTEAASSVLGGTVTVPVSDYAIEGSPFTFDFFVPERFLTPATPASAYTYPLGNINDGVGAQGYANVREEDRRYCQRYKPLLLGEGQKATYVTIKGKYSDHQGNNFDITYDIYLGKDNYGNFDIVRNANYLNTVNIKGVTASADQAVNLGSVFIDHRVNVTRSLPVIVNLLRETQLDSHFEVRPMRIRYPLKAGESLPAGAKVKVEILNQNNPETGEVPGWIRMEHNNGDGTGNATYCASGKRRYFTTDLVTNTLHDKSSIEFNLNGAQQETVWIYVDENTTAPGGDGRKAMIRVTYSDVNGTQDPLEYTVFQYALYPVETTRLASDVTGTSVASGSYTYYIEHEEEYLHNYDTEDTFGNTEDAGMQWGLNGVQLSHTDQAVAVKTSNTGWEWILSLFGWDKQDMVDEAIKKLDPQPHYDFYMVRDITPEAPIEHFYAYDGYNHNTKIISYLKSQYPNHQTEGAEAEKIAKLDKIALDEEPKSAIAYCYNRNKRNSDGTVAEIEWYLPAIDEIEDIAENAYGDFGTQFQGNMYWSCQPAYLKYDATWYISTVAGNQTVPATYFIDNKNRTRATKALRENGAFAGVPPSGDGTYATQNGEINKPAFRDPTTTMDDPVLNPNYDATCSQYEGNMSRSSMARVRCVRKLN